MFDNYSESCPPERRKFFITKACECYKIAIWGYFRNREMQNVRMLCHRFLQHNKKCFKIYIYLLFSLLPVKLINFITEDIKLYQWLALEPRKAEGQLACEV